MNCQAIIYDDAYADYIVDITSSRGRVLLESAECIQKINQEYAVIHVKRGQNNRKDFLYYQNLPRLFGLLESTDYQDEAGITELKANPGFDLLGQNVIFGIIDTGIDYRHPLFRKEDGSSRIGVIWDQSMPSERMDEQFPYGTIFSREEINKALQADNPYEIVPSKDENGHGTFLTGIAAGGIDENEDQEGIAPLCELAVVKLKQAKAYLKKMWMVSESTEAFQETDIFLGIRFLFEYAYKKNQPIVILLGCGTNSGNHGKSDYLKNYMNYISVLSGKCIFMAAGNEGSLGHHYRGFGLADLEYQDVEFQVEEGEEGLSIELWAEAPDLYEVGFISPGGEYVNRIPISLSQGDAEADFILEPTTIRVIYEPVERTTGNMLVWMRMNQPSAGIWKIRVFKNKVLNGRYDIWLPMEKFVRTGTRFLIPDPFTTICEPGNAENPITVTAYDSNDGGLYFHAGRGYTRDNDVKPDFAAPGVGIPGPEMGNKYRTGTGTSVAAAVAAGCAVLLFSYRREDTGLQIKNLLIKGAVRNQFDYPNREWGYGKLNVYNSILSLTNII